METSKKTLRLYYKFTFNGKSFTGNGIPYYQTNLADDEYMTEDIQKHAIHYELGDEFGEQWREQTFNTNYPTIYDIKNCGFEFKYAYIAYKS